MSLKERFVEIESNINKHNLEDAINAMKDIESEYGINTGMDSFISNEDTDVDDFVERRMESGGWQGVACCISDIVNSLSDSYYHIDGYENLELVTSERVEAYLSDLKRELSDELEMEEEEDEELD
jgi:hypothetical protein